MTRTRMTRWSRTIVAALAGGSLLGACDARVRDAFVQGSKDYLFNTLLNPFTITESLFPTSTDETDGTDETVDTTTE